MNQTSNPRRWNPLRFFAPGPAALPIRDRAEVDRRYRQLRFSVGLTLLLGYGFAYTCRLGLSVVKKPLIDGGIYTAQDLGMIGAAFLWAYGLGKLFNGALADRVNVRRFIPTGLAISALVNLAMGFNTMVVAAVVLWALNGWFQGFGAPASVVSITQWFHARERGTVYGIWSTAHSVGEGLTYFGTATLVGLTVWNAAFLGPGLFCLVASIAVYLGLRDRPETVGLPPVNRWKAKQGEEPPPQEAEFGVLDAQLALIKSPVIWVLGLSTATMYVTRYAVNNWGILYLQEHHGLSLTEAGGLIGINTLAGIGGSVAYGWISDRFFASRRPPLTLIFGIAELLSLALIFYGPQGNSWLLGAGFVVYGFTLSGLLAVLGGLFAVDISDKRAVGAAMGFIGAFSYLGAGLQELISGYLIEQGTTMVDGVRHYDFSTPVAFWVGASVVSAVLAATLWRVEVKD